MYNWRFWLRYLLYLGIHISVVFKKIVSLFLGCFSENYILLFTYQKRLQKFREYIHIIQITFALGFCFFLKIQFSFLQIRRGYDFLFTSIHQIHQNILPLNPTGCKTTYFPIIIFVFTIT